MKGLNRATLMGHVGRDPEIRYLEEDVAVCTIPLATSESYTSKTGERVTQTEWHNVVLWRKLAEIAEKYVKKGDPIYVEGRIRTRSYQDKEHPSITRYSTEIVATDLHLLGRRDGENTPAQVTGQAQPNAASKPPVTPQPAKENNPDVYEEDDDLPF